MDCPDACSLEVEVKDGKISRIGPSDLNPDTQGFICAKVSRFARRVYNEDRILFPLRRVGKKGAGEFERISWELAAETICAQFKGILENWGGEAILPYSYGGSNGILGQDTSDKAFFAKLGASRLARTVCAAPTTAAAMALYGKMPGTAFEDYTRAKCIIIWGANPKASNIHLVPYLREAKSAGAKIIVIDPKLNFAKGEFDLHLPVYPGTDLVLALAMVNIWHKQNLLNDVFLQRFVKNVEVLLDAAESYPLDKAAEITRIEPGLIERAAEIYAFHDPAVLRVGWGLERNRNGTRAAAAILALPALLGKFGRPGSGYTLSNGNAYRQDASQLIDAPEWRTRTINMNRLGRTLLHESNPPIKSLFVYNCNPVATVPDQKAIMQGLARPDLFTIVSEQVMTDTAKFADIVLPAVTFLEQHELKTGYGSYVAQYISPVIEPRGEAKPNEELFALLGRQMGWSDEAFMRGTSEYLASAAVSLRGFRQPLTIAEMAKNPVRELDFDGGSPVQFMNVFPWTPDSKINLGPEELGEKPYEYIPERQQEFPLALISPASEKLISSTLGEFNFPQLFLYMHPQDAAARELRHGDSTRCFNHLGAVVANLRISDHIRPGVVVLPKGVWRKASSNGLTSTALVADTLETVAGGACFNDARVEVQAA